MNVVPSPVARYLETAYPYGPPAVGSAVVVGPARFRRRPLPWLPLRSTISLHPGVDRAADQVVGMGPVTFLRILDAYVDGRGITRVGGKADIGGHIDQGAMHPMLCETLMFPGAWEDMQELSWEGIDDTTCRMLFEFRGGVEAPVVGFDPATRFPASYEVARYQGSGPKVIWRLDMSGWRQYSDVWFPERVTVRWANEPGPWYILRTTRVTVGTDIEAALDRARAALAAAEV